MTYLNYLEQKVLLERLVIGLEEPVLVKGLGELSAKIDSGNGGYNVIHGTDFHQQGDKLMFTTHDSFGHDKKIQAKVIDTIEINMGGGNIETRPVIELDIKFAGEDYKKIPFSVSDRSTNSNPILISKGFVENELEALIDVGAMNISHEGRDVVYGEGFLSGLATVGKAVGKAGSSIAKGVGNATKTLGKGAMGAADWLKGGDNVSLLSPVKGAASMVGDVAKGAVGALGALGGKLMLKKVSDIANSIVHGKNVLNYDKKTISSKLASTAIPEIIKKQPDADIDTTIIPYWQNIKLDSLPIIPVTSFLCCKGDDPKNIISGLEQKRKQWKKAIGQAKRAILDVKEENKSNSKEEQEEVLFEYFTLLENDLILNEADNIIDDAISTAVPDAQTTGTDSSTLDSSTVTPDDESTTSQPDAADNLSPDEINEIQTDFESLQKFTLWFVSIKNNINSSQKELDEINKELEPLQQKYKELLAKNEPLSEGQENKTKREELQKKKKNLEATQEENKKVPDKNSEQVISKIIQSSDSILSKLFSLGEGGISKFETILPNLSKIIQEQGGQGFFAMGYEVNENKREYTFFEDIKSIAYQRKDSGEENSSSDEDNDNDETSTPENDINKFTEELKKKLPLNDIEKKIDFDYTTINDEIANGKPGSLFDIIINNPNYFPNSKKYIDSYTSPDTPQDEKKDALNKFNRWASKEYPKYAISQKENGEEILNNLGDFEWNGIEDFINKCFDNEQIRQMILDTDEQEEDPWVTSKLNYFKSKGLI